MFHIHNKSNQYNSTNDKTSNLQQAIWNGSEGVKYIRDHPSCMCVIIVITYLKVYRGRAMLCLFFTKAIVQGARGGCMPSLRTESGLGLHA
jgi:hypothetical protein